MIIVNAMGTITQTLQHSNTSLCLESRHMQHTLISLHVFWKVNVHVWFCYFSLRLAPYFEMGQIKPSTFHTRLGSSVMFHNRQSHASHVVYAHILSPCTRWLHTIKVTQIRWGLWQLVSLHLSICYQLATTDSLKKKFFSPKGRTKVSYSISCITFNFGSIFWKKKKQLHSLLLIKWNPY